MDALEEFSISYPLRIARSQPRSLSDHWEKIDDNRIISISGAKTTVFASHCLPQSLRNHRLDDFSLIFLQLPRGLHHFYVIITVTAYNLPA